MYYLKLRSPKTRAVLAFSILILLICLPDIIFYVVVSQPFKLIKGLLFVGSIFLIPVILFHKKIKIYIYILLLLSFFSLLASIPVFYFGIILNSEVMQLIYNTSYTEASELLTGYLWQIILAIIAFILIAIFILKFIPEKVSRGSAWKISGACLVIILIIPALGFGFKNYSKQLRGTLITYYPFYIEYYGKQFYEEIKLAEQHPSLVKDFHFDVKSKKQIPERQIYILFIGESSRYDHWGINGYNRNTSPLLSRQPNILSFKNVCTAGGMTGLSVPLILTQAKPWDYLQHYYQKSIISLFNEAGFRTYWISDQIDGANVMMHAREADSVILLQSGTSTTSHIYYDMQLMSYLKQVVKEDTSNLFIIIHTLGSHFAYNFRYPANYNYFHPSEGKKILQPDNKSLKEVYINQYDNSILYDDAVIDSTIHIINQKNTLSFLYYISDHGENLYDDDRNLFAHPPIKPSKYIVHVPLFIFTSDAYNKAFPNKLLSLKSHIEAPISGDNTFNTLANMANIEFKGQDSTQSFASKSFKDTVRIILGGDKVLYNYEEVK